MKKLDNYPREQLIEIVHRFSKDIIHDSAQCEGLLRDYAGKYKSEVFLLSSAVKIGLIDDMYNQMKSGLGGVIIGPLAIRFQDECGISLGNARWALESWAMALDIKIIKTEISKKSKVSQKVKISDDEFPKTYVNDMHLNIMDRPRGSNERWRKLEPKGGEITLPQGYQFAIKQSVNSDAELESLLDKVQSISAFQTVGLILENSNITDAGLAHLKNLTELTYLDLSNCEQITENAKRSLKESIPGLYINRN